MNRLVVLFIVALFSVINNSCNKVNNHSDSFSENIVEKEVHMSFKNIEMNTPIDSFCLKLESEGYKIIAECNEGVIMEGYFMEEKSNILIYGLPPQGVVSGVQVLLDIDNFTPTWASLEKKYYEYRKLLNEKYGSGECEEKFVHPYFNGCGDEIKAIKDGKCLYQSLFKAEGGCITLSFHELGLLSINYEDSINKKEVDKLKSAQL